KWSSDCFDSEPEKMPAALPLICYLLIFVDLEAYTSDKREGAVFAACLLGCLLYAMTETLSVGHLLTRLGLIAAWSLACLVATWWTWKQRRAREALVIHVSGGEKKTLGIGDKVLLGGISLLVLLVGLTAVVSPPNNWDAMCYHLTRVATWISNRSVQFFPTMDFERLGYSPFAEYAML